MNLQLATSEMRKDLKINVVCLNVFLIQMKFSTLITMWYFLFIFISWFTLKKTGVKSGRGKILVENMTATDGTGDAEKWNKWFSSLFLCYDSSLGILGLYSQKEIKCVRSLQFNHYSKLLFLQHFSFKSQESKGHCFISFFPTGIFKTTIHINIHGMFQ